MTSSQLQHVRVLYLNSLLLLGLWDKLAENISLMYKLTFSFKIAFVLLVGRPPFAIINT